MKYKSILQDVITALTPPKKYTVSQWADSFRYLSSSGSAESGKYRTSRTEYARQIMDSINQPIVEKIVFMASAQIGKSEILNNIVGYFTHIEPAPILFVLPTASDAEDYSKNRIAPMYAESPAFKGLILEDTIKSKTFVGGYLALAGSNTPSKLASRPIRVAIIDEVDRVSRDVEGEGSAVSLVEKRMTTFYNRKFIMASTPTIAEQSLIEQQFNLSESKNKYFISCPHCRGEQYLIFPQIKWLKTNDISDPSTAYYECTECGAEMSDGDINRAVISGRWKTDGRDTFVAAKSTAFHIWEIYSPFVTMEEIVSKFLEAKKEPSLLKAFTNLSLGECWVDDIGEELDWENLYRRKEDYYNIGSSLIPSDILLITAGVDTQDDRLEYQIVGWGHNNESWILDYGVLYGSPAEKKVWEDLKEILDTSFTTEYGSILKIIRTFIDKGGHFGEDVMKFCHAMRHKNVFAIYGSNNPLAPVVPNKASTNNILKVATFALGVTSIKETLFAKLQTDKFGENYIHFNQRLDEEYFKMLTAEKMYFRMSQGRYVKSFKKIRARNEALDTLGYAYAAMVSMKPNFDRIQQSIGLQSIKETIADLPRREKTEIENIEVPTKDTEVLKNRGKYKLVRRR